jgi:hypothetical protein
MVEMSMSTIIIIALVFLIIGLCVGVSLARPGIR